MLRSPSRFGFRRRVRPRGVGDATPEVLRGAGDCVNDGAQANPLFGTQGKAACDSIPGLFIQVNAKIWECNYAEGNPPNFTYTASLNTACDLNTNGLGFLVVSGQSENVNAFCEL